MKENNKVSGNWEESSEKSDLAKYKAKLSPMSDNTPAEQLKYQYYLENKPYTTPSEEIDMGYKIQIGPSDESYLP